MAETQTPPADRPQEIRLADYKPPAFLIDTVDLVFDLAVDETRVTNRMTFRRNPARPEARGPLRLDGQALTLVRIDLDGEPIGKNRYDVDKDGLTLLDPPDAGTLDIVTTTRPGANTALSGLYASGDMLTTQCEAQGFRRITYFQDRPDVLASYTVTLLADEGRHPVLLSNGNLVDEGKADDGRHWAKWHDPFLKPSYLFALVAGDLDVLTDRFTTRSGRAVDLHIYAAAHDIDKCGYAMEALKASMAWDERVFGLEYDLDRFNIVAVGDFNAGAMENKSLNIFNTALLLAKPDTATDADYRRIESVVAHEYFHNWTGNRITCRDWFQLTLKEGLTVFRDQLFSADQGSPAVQRIEDVRRLRASQFPEDAGPMSHPIRPESYIAVDNFYTATVYEKGAEVIRMIQTLIGWDAFRAGMDLYVERHDGEAVTCEDFIAAMEAASGRDLSQFRLWYSQAGTPELDVDEHYDRAAGTFVLTLRQTVPRTPGQATKKPVPIPVAVGLLSKSGAEMAPRLDGQTAAEGMTQLLELTQAEQSFTFHGLDERPTPSLLRGYSAPVRLTRPSIERAAFLFGHDTDPFARWEAGQQLATACLLDMVATIQQGDEPTLPEPYIEAYGHMLADDSLDNALKAEAAILPSEDYLADQMDVVDPEAIYQARHAAQAQLGQALDSALRGLVDANTVQDTYAPTAEQIGRRALRTAALHPLAAAQSPYARQCAIDLARSGANMTDVLAGLGVLRDWQVDERDDALSAFYQRWRHEPLVVDKWFTLQATSRLPGTVDAVRALADHPDFSLKVPNRVRALLGGFALGNPRHFHARDGQGYRFLADQVIALDGINPQVAARLLTPLSRWRRVDQDRQAAMRAELQRIADQPDLSKEVYEVASKSLG